MNTVIRDFKRHYHRVKRAYSDLAKTGNFGFHAKGDGTSMTASCETPDPKETVRFAVLMRRFLISEDSLHYKNVWNTLQSGGEYEIPEVWIKGIDSLIEKVEAGYGQIKINSEELSPQKIYNVVSDAGYFSDDEEATKY